MNLGWQVYNALAWLKCIYTNAQCGQQGEGTGTFLQQEGFDVVTITETWRDDSHHGGAAVAGYKLFRTDRQSRRGGWIALYNRECFGCIEIDDEDDEFECLWVRITRKVSRADVMVGVCWRPPSLEQQVAEVAQSPAFLLMGDFNLPDIC